jgi:hypothetical protein
MSCALTYDPGATQPGQGNPSWPSIGRNLASVESAEKGPTLRVILEDLVEVNRRRAVAATWRGIGGKSKPMRKLSEKNPL